MPLADHHSAIVLTKIARKVLHSPAQLQILPNAGVPHIEASSLEGVLQRVAWPLPLPRAHQSREPSSRLFIETQRLARFAGGGAAAVCRHIRGHGRSQFAISLIDILNGTLTVGHTRQVEVNIRPLAALLR